MNQLTAQNPQEEWLKVLGKGMVTIPKKWRQELGIREGDVVQAKKEGDTVVIQSQVGNNAPYRIYTDSEIDEFLQEDKIPKELSKKAKAELSSFSNP
ncbi:hypothetical protein A3D77_00840 [Candidatus Gottesmanbacteria bacterium RIFCSPHIGHO2_02_FULL_39_11]|uniref:SpoVT-AbrB domain-containing protein n=1 Tax=Candidatus Gottesmanbacteria bacterium RIFCSPHIGHO2_02_FULL_39_11 TaxID=1798382 RepID=A0A1F5ZNF7_9BACT|nr:MAG: hypothetical protein A3D77_00840 [Candidatus Gottesmanbacteria bacterium RIFCSPHIGHO2_02_FULL_39_11]